MLLDEASTAQKSTHSGSERDVGRAFSQLWWLSETCPAFQSVVWLDVMIRGIPGI